MEKRTTRMKEDQQNSVRREEKSRTRNKEKKIIRIKEDYQSTIRRKEKLRKKSIEKKIISIKKDYQSTVRREKKSKAEKLIKSSKDSSFPAKSMLDSTDNSDTNYYIISQQGVDILT